MTEKLIINGDRPLQGELTTHGAKNSALPLLAATLLTDQPVTLRNLPELDDVQTMLRMIANLGKNVDPISNGVYRITGSACKAEAPSQLVQKMRASFLVLAPLASRLGEAHVALPGGCTIGSRPINLHLKGLAKLGAEVRQQDGTIRVSTNSLTGEDIFLDYPSVGSTEQLLMGAVLAKGTTTIHNPAREPEVMDLIKFLQKLGADVAVTNTTIRIRGVDDLGGAPHQVIPDRIEAGTYLIATAATTGEITVKDINPQYLKSVILKLRETGMEIKESSNSILLRSEERPASAEVKTLPYPGFPTDLQAPMTALLTIAKGESVVEETVFDSRVDHVPELNKLGAQITVSGSDTLFITGCQRLQGTSVEAPDIRAGAALVIGGLVGQGTTSIVGLNHIDRGYSEIAQGFRELGADIRRKS